MAYCEDQRKLNAKLRFEPCSTLRDWGITIGSDDMTGSGDGPNRPVNTTKKRFIGKAKAEALRKKAFENQSSGNIEDGVITLKGSSP